VNRWITRLLIVLLLVTLTASSAEAQRRRRHGSAVNAGPTYGAHFGYNFDADAAVFGAQLTYPFSPDLGFYPTFDYYFVSSGSLWALNFDLKWHPPTRNGVWYVGSGLNWSHASGGSDTGLNLLTGLEGRRGKTRPYLEGRFILDNGSSFQLVGGISWH
jgi:hypothetical protein